MALSNANSPSRCKWLVDHGLLACGAVHTIDSRRNHKISSGVVFQCSSVGVTRFRCSCGESANRLAKRLAISSGFGPVLPFSLRRPCRDNCASLEGESDLLYSRCGEREAEAAAEAAYWSHPAWRSVFTKEKPHDAQTRSAGPS